MKSLWFIVPVHGRLGLAKICLRQLQRTCVSLRENGIAASAVVVSDSYHLAVLNPEDLGFGWVRRDNRFLSRRFNDGIQLATDPRFNPAPVDYVVPFGSDDWADYRLFLEPLPEPDTVFGFRWISFVNEDASEISHVFLDYEGGAGIRIIPREAVAPLGYRPADEDRERNCDMSILHGLRAHHGNGFKVKHYETPPEWIVDWKTSEEQLNAYKVVTAMRGGEKLPDPFAALSCAYPEQAISEMAQFYRDPVV